MYHVCTWIFCMSGVFKPAGQNTTAIRTSLFKLRQPMRKTNHGQKSLSNVHLVFGTNCHISQIAIFQKRSARTSTELKKFFFAKWTLRKSIFVAINIYVNINDVFILIIIVIAVVFAVIVLIILLLVLLFLSSSLLLL